MKYLIQGCRWFVGILFIFSGLIKLNDPIGFSYKLDEYFSATVLNLEFLQPFVLPLAIFIVIFEVILGLMLLLGFQKKFTLWSLLLMIVFFTFLTFYSAYFNKVTDCGCFGDAIPLTPWESFIKDLILLVLIVLLVWKQEYINPAFAKARSSIIIFIASMLCFTMAYYVLMHLPILDFRAYKVGTDIEKDMQQDPNRPAIYGYDWYFMVDGKEKIVTTKGSAPTGYGAYTKVETRLIDKGFEPPIHGFELIKDDTDFTAELLAQDKVAFIVMYNLDLANTDGLSKIKSFVSRAQKKGYTIAALSASPQSRALEIQEAYEFSVPFYTVDETALKTIERSNPSFMLVEKGVIKAKSHWNDVAELDL